MARRSAVRGGGLGRNNEPSILILTSLASEPKHGYALLKDVEQLSGGRTRLSTGTLYGAIRRLLEDGWIERFKQQDTSRDKQAYRLTAKGKVQLHSEFARLHQLLHRAANRLGAGLASTLRRRPVGATDHLALAAAQAAKAADSKSTR